MRKARCVALVADRETQRRIRCRLFARPREIYCHFHLHPSGTPAGAQKGSLANLASATSPLKRTRSRLRQRHVRPPGFEWKDAVRESCESRYREDREGKKTNEKSIRTLSA
jgi:hypothetical protein